VNAQHAPNRALLVLTHRALLEDTLHDGAALRRALIAEGWAVDVSNLRGGGRPEDDVDQPSNAAWVADPEIGAELEAATGGIAIDPADYDVVCFIGSRGSTWGSPMNHDLSRLVAGIADDGRITRRCRAMARRPRARPRCRCAGR
jgi:hypothetical protein